MLIFTDTKLCNVEALSSLAGPFIRHPFHSHIIIAVHLYYVFYHAQTTCQHRRMPQNNITWMPFRVKVLISVRAPFGFRHFVLVWLLRACGCGRVQLSSTDFLGTCFVDKSPARILAHRPSRLHAPVTSFLVFLNPRNKVALYEDCNFC